ncbi:MAG: phage integrase SAM-like domain-containing protein [Vicingaceae bacterium]|nr:phage integrase SAM-like domain-containing protein [Vicingaceae bacterium]
MATVKFLYRSNKDQTQLTLRLFFVHNANKNRVDAKTNIFVSKQYWEKQHSKNTRDIDLINLQTEKKTEILELTKFVLESFNDANLDDINKEWLQKTVDEYYNPTKKRTKQIPDKLTLYVDYFLQSNSKNFKDQTIKNYKVVKSLLERFEAYTGHHYKMVEVDKQFKDDFYDFCQSKNYSINTISKFLDTIKALCRDARTNGIELSPQLDTLKIKTDKVDIIYLNFDELEQIENTKDLPDYLDNTRDWLIISCYTGQRVSDFMTFKPEMIRSENGKHYLEFTQQKTQKKMTIPLSPKVIEILDKRNGNFPRPISDQKYNDYLKLLCKKAGIDSPTTGSIRKEAGKGVIRKVRGKYPKYELISSHVGRRSFATNHYGTVPTTLLIYMTGHSSETMFLNYIGKSNKDLAIEAAKYF